MNDRTANERLRLLLDALSIKRVSLARGLNVDGSLVSKWTSGKRTLEATSPHLEPISLWLAHYALPEGLRRRLLSIIDAPADADDAYIAQSIKKYLLEDMQPLRVEQALRAPLPPPAPVIERVTQPMALNTYWVDDSAQACNPWLDEISVVPSGTRLFMHGNLCLPFMRERLIALESKGLDIMLCPLLPEGMDGIVRLIDGIAPLCHPPMGQGLQCVYADTVHSKTFWETVLYLEDRSLLAICRIGERYYCCQTGDAGVLRILKAYFNRIQDNAFTSLRIAQRTENTIADLLEGTGRKSFLTAGLPIQFMGEALLAQVAERASMVLAKTYIERTLAQQATLFREERNHSVRFFVWKRDLEALLTGYPAQLTGFTKDITLTREEGKAHIENTLETLDAHAQLQWILLDGAQPFPNAPLLLVAEQGGLLSHRNGERSTECRLQGRTIMQPLLDYVDVLYDRWYFEYGGSQAGIDWLKALLARI